MSRRRRSAPALYDPLARFEHTISTYCYPGSSGLVRLSSGRRRRCQRGRPVMSASILLLYVKTTGHVLTAATVAAPPDGEVKPEALAGQALPVQYLGNPPSPATALASVPANQLAVAAVDSQTVPIEQARKYFIK